MKCSQTHNTTNASYILVCIRQIIFLLINDGIQNGYQSRKVHILTYSFFSFIFTSPADLWGILSGPGNRVQTFFLD